MNVSAAKLAFISTFLLAGLANAQGAQDGDNDVLDDGESTADTDEDESDDEYGESDDTDDEVVGEPAVHAATPPMPTVSPRVDDMEPVDGFLLQARMLTQPTPVSNVVAAPSFIAGFRLGDFSLGLGVGLTFAKLSLSDEDSLSAVVFQLQPTAFYDVWSSSDGRTRFNLLAGLGIGRAGATIEDNGQDSDVSAILIPLLLGAGGDYFFHPNFGVGAETGYQGLFVTGVSSDDNDLEVGFGTQGLYAALRFTVLIGSGPDKYSPQGI